MRLCNWNLIKLILKLFYVKSIKLYIKPIGPHQTLQKNTYLPTVNTMSTRTIGTYTSIAVCMLWDLTIVGKKKKKKREVPKIDEMVSAVIASVIYILLTRLLWRAFHR